MTYEALECDRIELIFAHQDLKTKKEEKHMFHMKWDHMLSRHRLFLVTAIIRKSSLQWRKRKYKPVHTRTVPDMKLHHRGIVTLARYKLSHVVARFSFLRLIVVVA